MLFAICTVLVTLYVVIVLLATMGWLTRDDFDNLPEGDENASLVIPFRNEEHRLTPLIDSLKSLPDNIEIIFVDDHSNDKSAELLQKNGFNVITNEGEGKKEAVATGISRAKHHLVVFTDADCALSTDYFPSLKKHYSTTGFDFAYGPVIYFFKRNSIWNSIFFLDQLSLSAFAIGMGRFNFHVYCSGANMAGNKTVLCEASSSLKKSSNLSGDDLTLLNKMLDEEHQPLAMTSSNVLVKTIGPSGLGEFLVQRLRWGQKTGTSSKWRLGLVSVVVLLACMSCSVAIINSISAGWNNAWWLPIVAKFVIDLLFLFLVGFKLKAHHHLWFFIPAWLFNLTYIPLVAVTGLFYQGKWKGRKIRR